ncbi:CarboxypepD_reg-like domain-containing protein [Catalinimonas alkaloidigena]|uniref:CarboxypepD_reg-like domain-containing protein n=1 Tax=Catalinimonas alkaloidigena TaxID=1075417 RepID=A0A1G9T4E1_9BACT|nr:alpha-2-macroglobulin family protein [Catalinimonas alkaloidigena]SDM42624.1 CarboxypepD_reg-like domain-containing protein [Catalinimonas alkaloidigena]
MHRLYVLFLFLSTCSAAVQAQSSPDALRQSPRHYRYRLTDAEAIRLLEKGLGAVDSAFFHTPYDSVPRTADFAEAPSGYYLQAHVVENQVRLTFQPVRNVVVTLLDNQRDFALVLHDLAGDLIRDAHVTVGDRRVRFDAKTQAYRRSRSNAQGLLTVEWDGKRSYFWIDRQYNQSLVLRAVRPIIYLPLKYLWRPVRGGVGQLVRSIRYGDWWWWEHQVYRIGAWFEPKPYTGYLTFDQPKYRPGDTVRVKAFVTQKRGRPLRRPMYVRLYTQKGTVVLDTLTPYRPGGYEFTFVLHDNLRLQLDREYLLSFEKRPFGRDISASFRLEDYELKRTYVHLRSDRNHSRPGHPLTLHLQSVDANDLNLPDARIEVRLLAQPVKDWDAAQVFVPDTLWTHRQPLDPVGETMLELPDSVLPAASFPYRIEVQFSDAANEVQQKTLDVTHVVSTQIPDVQFQLVGDTLRIDPGTEEIIPLTGARRGDARRGNAQLVRRRGAVEEVQPIQLPYQTRIDPWVQTYRVVLDSGRVQEDFMLATQASQVTFLADRTADSLWIDVTNPRQVPLWYTLFRNQRPVVRGHGIAWRYATTAEPDASYSVTLEYPWGGKEVRHEHYTIPFQEKALHIAVTQPLVAEPGASIQTDIEVKDAAGRPVADVDLTAYGYTKDFRAAPTAVPYLGKAQRGRRAFNQFAFRAAPSATQTPLRQRFARAHRLDSLRFYRLLFPEGGYYQESHPLPDSSAELVPYVVEQGQLLHLYYVTLDQEPVYYHATQQEQSRAIRVDTGWHHVGLRTHDRFVSIDSVYLAVGHRLYLSIERDQPSPHVRHQPFPATYTLSEQEWLGRRLLFLRRTWGHDVVVRRNGQVWLPLEHTAPGLPLILGPMRPGDIVLHWPDGQTQRGWFEPGWEYEMEPELIKMRELPGGQSLRPRFQEQLTVKYAAFDGFAQEEPSLDEARVQERLRERRAVRHYQAPKYDLPSSTAEGYGRLQWQLRSPTNEPVRHVLLFRPDSAHVVRVAPGYDRELHQLAPGHYQLVLMLADHRYLIADSVDVRANGVRCLTLDTTHVHPADAFSIRAGAIILRETGVSAYVQDVRTQELRNIQTLYQSRAVPSTYSQWVTGKVVDHTGEGIPGVSILVKGSSFGTITDVEGQYQLWVPPFARLVIASVGYLSQEVDAQRESVIVLEEDIKQLSEVVVVGYATQRQRELTGTVVTTLSGKVAGMVILGNTTMAPAAPLVLVDGVPYAGNLADFGDTQQWRTERLSPQAGTALYGARAAGGVILITTQRSSPSSQGTIASSEGTAAYEVRQHFQDRAYWQPRLRTDRHGRASFTTTLPDDITAWETHVLAMDGKRHSGQVQGQIKAFKRVAAQLAVPRFLVAGDSTRVFGKLVNYTADSIHVTTQFRSGTTERQHEAHVKHLLLDTLALVAEGADSLAVEFSVQRDDGYQDGERRFVPVYPQGVTETEGFFAVLDQDTTWTLEVDSLPGTLHLYARAHALDFLLDEIEHVRTYGYLCNEQAASMLKMLVLEKRIRLHLDAPFRHEAQAKRLVKRLVHDQNTDQGWGWWPGVSAQPWISQQVVEALLMAQEEGWADALPEDTWRAFFARQLDKASAGDQLRLLQLLRQLDAPLAYEPRLAALAQDTTLSFHQHLQLLQLRQQLGLPYTLDTLAQTVRSTLFGNAYWGQALYVPGAGTSVTTTLLAYQLLRAQEAQQEARQEARQHAALLRRIRGYLLEARQPGYWRNTYESAQVVETLLPDVLREQHALSLPQLRVNGAVVTNFPLERTWDTNAPLTLQKTGGGTVYLTAYQRRFNPAPERVTGDFTVTTHFKEGGKPVTDLTTGQPVTLVVDVTTQQAFEYVMVEVPIPAGCSYGTKTHHGNEVHREYFREKTAIFCQRLAAGTHAFEIELVPRFSGRYHLNPARAELMYFPTFYGREGQKQVLIP